MDPRTKGTQPKKVKEYREEGKQRNRTRENLKKMEDKGVAMVLHILQRWHRNIEHKERVRRSSGGRQSTNVLRLHIEHRTTKKERDR
jgi:hypothetical protein